ncbi:MAG: recombinase family protein [Planctomycetota bacterium]
MAKADERTRSRCAIYTRKSTEEGLEQAFNSLDAQYEACAAYIQSQRHEGWTLVKDRYDDGGFSGGTMERPALKRLLADVEAGRVDVIVVYKVDRLTRALSDFARIVDVLDARGASFVSVTQAFNTTTSMGRLTLNVLLSFAQFEREVTGERIRDKIAASKKKGMWMGGPVPLGYAVEDRKLLVVEHDATIVRHIFERYVALGSGQALIEELRSEGYRTKLRKHGDNTVGGVPFSRGMLFALLSNRIYRGEVVHKGAAHPGEHDAIIEQALWDAVQQTIEANRVERKAGHNIRHPSLLAGIIFDGLGRRMSPSHAVKQGKRYRYYITHGSELIEGSPSAWRLPAHDIEQAVVDQVKTLLGDKRHLRSLIPDGDAQQISTMLGRAEKAATQIGTPYGRKAITMAVVKHVWIEEDRICITIETLALLRQLGIETMKTCDPIMLIAQAQKIRRGNETRLVLEGGSSIKRDERLIALLTEARSLGREVNDNPDRTIADLAKQASRCRKRMAQLVRLNWLAPDIVQAIIDGRQPARLTATTLLDVDLPIAWTEQRTLLGFAA